MSAGPSTRRRPTWLPLLAMAAVLPVLLWLGSWQLHRAEQKQDLFDRFGTVEAAVPLTGVLSQSPEAVRYRRVTASGRYLPEKQFLMEGLTHEGRPGMHVLTPFELAHEGSVIVVNRGWIPDSGDRTSAPDVSLDGVARSISGRVVPYPEPGLRLQAEPGVGWPRRVIYPTPGELADQLDLPSGQLFLPHMIWLSAEDEAGFVRDWKPAEFGPARHVGYAVQWFGLAVTLVMIYLIMRFRKNSQTERASGS